jgi:hypothetical protein
VGSWSKARTGGRVVPCGICRRRKGLVTRATVEGEFETGRFRTGKMGESVRASDQGLEAMRSPMPEPVVFPSVVSLFFVTVGPHATTPNKAPEPTTFAVTSRAIVRSLEMKQQNRNRDGARSAPAKVVAHL